MVTFIIDVISKVAEVMSARIKVYWLDRLSQKIHKDESVRSLFNKLTH